MALNETQQKRYDEYRAQLEKFEAGALAHEMAMMFLFVPLLPIPKIIAQAKENSRIIRHNKRVTTNNNKYARLKMLCNKSRATKADHLEMEKLCRDLGIKIPAEVGDV